MTTKIKENPIRIAHIMGKFLGGGVESVVFNYYRAIDKTKIQFDFFYDADSTVKPPQELINMGARFYKLPPYQRQFSYLKTLRGYLKANKYKIVHSHINTLSVFPLFAAWKEKVPVRIAHNHSVPGGNEFKKNILKQFLRIFAKTFSTDYFACSEKAARWMFGNKTFDNGKVYIVKNAIDFDKFRPTNDEVKLLKDQLNLNNKLVIAHVGRFTYAKNHSFLLDLFFEILKYRNDAVLLLVGDGELHEQIVKKIDQLDMSNNVVMTGQVANPEKYYRLADVIVLPSIFEGLSLTTVESQIAGIPVVISDAIPQEAVISDGIRYMSLSDSVNDWAKMILQTAGIKVNLNRNSEDYRIELRAKILCSKYIELQKCNL